MSGCPIDRSPDNREARLEDFSQVIQWETQRGQRAVGLAGTFKGFSRATRDDSARVFRDPADLGVFFHPTCAPKLHLTEKMTHDHVTMLVDILIARYEAESREVREAPLRFRSRRSSSSPVMPRREEAPVIKLGWQRISKLTEACSHFAKTRCVSIQADSRGCPIRVGKATEGLEATSHTKRIAPRPRRCR